MSISIIHTNIFTNHTTTYFTLTNILDLTQLSRQLAGTGMLATGRSVAGRRVRFASPVANRTQ